jgi:hypothetical protein
VRLPPPGTVFGPLLRQVQLPIHQRLAACADVGQEDADLAVVYLTEPAAPLPGDPAGVRARLGEGTGVQDQHGLGLGQFLGDVLAQLGHHRFVVPAACADKVLHRLAVATGLVGDGLGGLALQVAELALQDHARQFLLLDPVKAGQVAPQEISQAVPATGHGSGGNLGIGQQSLSRRVVEQGHPCHSRNGASFAERRWVSIPLQEKRLQSK